MFKERKKKSLGTNNFSTSEHPGGFKDRIFPLFFTFYFSVAAVTSLKGVMVYSNNIMLVTMVIYIYIHSNQPVKKK